MEPSVEVKVAVFQAVLTLQFTVAKAVDTSKFTLTPSSLTVQSRPTVETEMLAVKHRVEPVQVVPVAAEAPADPFSSKPIR
jgi:hypothetical protein